MFIEPSLVSNVSVFNVISQYATCVICEGILYNPIQCSSCENFFCEDCLNKWKKESLNCPFRCKEPKYKKNVIINKLLSQLEIKCQNGCGAIIKYENMRNHFENECMLINYKEKINDVTENLIKEQNENTDLQICTQFLKTQIEFLTKQKAPIKNKAYSNRHSHILDYNKRINFWICDVCGKHYRDIDKSFRCEQCDFDICPQCYLKEMFNIS